MKKKFLILFLAVISIHAYSQKGDLSVGAKGGYLLSTDYYKGFLYGIDVAYHLTYPFEIAFTGLMNPDISYENINKAKKQLAAYSANVDFRLYLMNNREWATGPALGANYYIVDDKTEKLGAYKSLGFNIGWHFRFSLTDYLKVNGGWRYTNAKAKDRSSWRDDSTFDISHHLIYLGLSYTFELK